MNLADELKKITGQVTSSMTEGAKDSAIKTLNDPEFRASISSFTRQWIEDNKVMLMAVIGSCLLLSMLAITNIISNYKRS